MSTERRILKPQVVLTFCWSLLLATGCVTARKDATPESTDAAAPAAATKPRAETRTNRVDEASKDASAEYHFSLAQAYAADGNTDMAIEEYKLTLVFDPNSAMIYARLATEYVKKGLLSEAMETCKEALKRDPNHLDVRLILAGLYSTTRDSVAALAEYDRVLKIDPRHEEATVYKSQVLAEDGKYADAAKILRDFVRREKDAALSWYYLGRMEHQLDHTKEAVRAFKTVMALKPGFTQAGLALGYLYEEKRMNPQAIATYRELYEDAQDLTAASRLATLLLKAEKYEAAIPYLQALEQADPDDMTTRVKLGLVQMELHKFDQAIATFKKILEKNPNSDRIHYYLGSLYEEGKQYDLAIQELKQIPSDSKLFGDAALHVAYLHKQASRMPEARASIEDAIVRSPRNPGFYIFKASLEEETKDFPQAIATLEQAVGQFPEDEKIRYYLGSIYDRTGDIDKGLEHMEAILRLNPENVDALNYVGYTWTLRGVRLNDAERLLRRALGLRPENGYVQDSWGWYLFTRGRVKEAIVQLEKAARLKPNEPTILEHLGDAYARYNLREKALAQYASAARLADTLDLRDKIQAKAENMRKELAQGRPTDVLDREPARMPAGASNQPAIREESVEQQ